VLQANPRKLMNLDGMFIYVSFSLSLFLSLEIPRQIKAKYFAKVVAKEISLNDHF